MGKQKIEYIYGGYWPTIDYIYTEREYTGKGEKDPKVNTVKVCKVLINK